MLMPANAFIYSQNTRDVKQKMFPFQQMFAALFAQDNLVDNNIDFRSSKIHRFLRTKRISKLFFQIVGFCLECHVEVTANRE